MRISNIGVNKYFSRDSWGIILIFILITPGFWGCETKELPTTCKIVQPANNSLIDQGDTVVVLVNASNAGGTLEEVRFDIDGKGICTTCKYPFRYTWITAGKKPGMHSILATAFYEDGIIVSSEVLVSLSAGGDTGRVSDYEGNSYSTVKIGNQWWMAENLRTEVFPDGTGIQVISSPDALDTLDNSDKALCYRDYDADSLGVIYGALYTWAAARNGKGGNQVVQGVCPTGWHLPSDEEWKLLEVNLGLDPFEANETGWRGSGEGAKLKEKGSVHWECSNTVADNSYGFTALPGGGGRWVIGNSYSSAFFWTSTQDIMGGIFRHISCQIESIRRDATDGGNFYSVRCVKDKITSP
jgi:uncharacterized protein (TIGR02145 family)